MELKLDGYSIPLDGYSPHRSCLYQLVVETLVHGYFECQANIGDVVLLQMKDINPKSLFPHPRLINDMESFPFPNCLELDILVLLKYSPNL